MKKLYETTKREVSGMPGGRDAQHRGPVAAAVAALVEAGMTVAQAVDFSWRVETGKPTPVWLDEMGNQTSASRDWDRGHESRHHGEG